VSVSIDYHFRHANDLRASGELANVASEWDKAFGGRPYTPWGWHGAERSGDGFLIQGATKLPDDANQAWGAIQIAADLLSRLRNSAGGSVVTDNHGTNVTTPYDFSVSGVQLSGNVWQ